MKCFQRAILYLGTLLILAAPVAAQQIDSPYRFIDTKQFAGVWAGYVNTSEGPLNMGPQSAPVFGGRWAIRVSGPFAFGVEVGFMPSKRTVRDTTFTVADSSFAAIGEANASILTVIGNLRVNITGARTWKGLQPFALFGGGLAADLAGTAAVEDDLAADERVDFGTSFAGQLGAGVEWFPSSRISARVDGRNVLWKLSVPDAFARTPYGRTFPRSAWEQNLVLSAGVSIHF